MVAIRELAKRAALLATTQLRPHQERIALTGLDDEARKLLYHSLGSGKSLSSLAAAETAGDPYTAVTPASLRPNYRKEQDKFTDRALPSHLVSYNALAKGGVPKTPTVLFDEAQRLRNENSQTTQQAQELARDAEHLYLLSATPVVNHPTDLAPLISMLTQRPMTNEEFSAKFIGKKRVGPGLLGRLRGIKPAEVPVMQNHREFRRLLDGHVDYFAPDKPEVERKDETFHSEMSPQQHKLYRGFWNQLPTLTRWKLQRDFPLSREEMVRLHSFLTGPRQVGLSTLPFAKGTASPLKAFETSPKLQQAFGEMQKALTADPRARAVAFSNFIDAGLTPYGAGLEKAKIPWAMFHGGLSDGARKKVVENYNAGKIRALLLGPSGGEGISLKGTRLLQLLDPHWNSARSEQAVGRGIRYDSHTHLPVNDRNVRVQRFVSRLPRTTRQRLWQWFTGAKQDVAKQRPAVDTYLEEMNRRKDDLNNQFMDELKRIGTPA